MLEVSHPGKVNFERVLPVEDIEEWATNKKETLMPSILTLNPKPKPNAGPTGPNS